MSLSCVFLLVLALTLLTLASIDSSSSHQVNFQICCATAVLISCSTDLTYGQTFVQMSLLPIKSKCLPNFRFQISCCIVNSIGVVRLVVVTFPSDMLENLAFTLSFYKT